MRANLLHFVAKYAHLWWSSCVLKHLKKVKSPNLKSCVSRSNFTFFPTFLICSCQFNFCTVNSHVICGTTWNKSFGLSLYFGVTTLMSSSSSLREPPIFISSQRWTQALYLYFRAGRRYLEKNHGLIWLHNLKLINFFKNWEGLLLQRNSDESFRVILKRRLLSKLSFHRP